MIYPVYKILLITYTIDNSFQAAPTSIEY